MTGPMTMKSTDIAEFLHWGISDARYLIMKFERDGKMERYRKRNKLVDIHIFSEWYAWYFHLDYKDVLKDVKEWMADRYAPAGSGLNS